MDQIFYQTKQTLGQTIVQTIGQNKQTWGQTIVQTIGQTKQTLGQTIVQTIGQTKQTWGQTFAKTIGQKQQTLGQITGQAQLNMKKHIQYNMFIIFFSFNSFELCVKMRIKTKKLLKITSTFANLELIAGCQWSVVFSKKNSQSSTHLCNLKKSGSFCKNI